MAAEDSKGGDDSGVVKVGDDVMDAYKALKLRRKHKYLVFKIDETDGEYKLVVEATGGPRAKFEEMKKALPATEPRYVVYDHEYTSTDGRPTDKLYLIVWTPATSRPHMKTFYSSQKLKVTSQFTGVEDLHVSSGADLEKGLGLRKDESDSDDDEWDPDA